MRLSQNKAIKDAMKDATDRDRHLYIHWQNEWFRVWRTRIRHNRSTGEKYPIIETTGGQKITVRSEGMEFDVR